MTAKMMSALHADDPQLEEAMRQAMRQRHTVRNYIDAPIPQRLLRLLRQRMDLVNHVMSTHIQLRTNDGEAFNSAVRLIMGRNASNYFVMAGQRNPTLDERLGYAGADLMLYAQTLGLNTWWVGGTFNKSRLSRQTQERVIAVIAVGRGETQGKPHKSKTPDEVSRYHGDPTPDWFTHGVQGALLAPTAINRQAFFIAGKDDMVSIDVHNTLYTEEDRGIIAYHFEMAAGADNFHWIMPERLETDGEAEKQAE